MMTTATLEIVIEHIRFTINLLSIIINDNTIEVIKIDDHFNLPEYWKQYLKRILVSARKMKDSLNQRPAEVLS